MTPEGSISSFSDDQRMALRGKVLLAAEIIAKSWPMRTFVHHNPLHGLEFLPFAQAVKVAGLSLGGRGYLSDEEFREIFRSGRITEAHLDQSLGSVAGSALPVVLPGGRKITRLEVFRAQLLAPISPPSPEVIEAVIGHHPDRTRILSLVPLLSPAPLGPGDPAERGERPVPLSDWSDRDFGIRITELINGEMIKWCEAFLDENHATWSMPGREQGFFRAWKSLCSLEWSPCGIKNHRKPLERLPSTPEDALLEHLTVLEIPEDLHQGYLSRHLAALPGWAAFIKWRADQSDYPFQQSYPADLVEYLAVRLWYERELLASAIRENPGRRPLREGPEERGESRGLSGTHSPGSKDRTGLLGEGWRLVRLAREVGLSPEALAGATPCDLRTLLDWMDSFPEESHGAVWLEAYERGYRDPLLASVRGSFSALQGTTGGVAGSGTSMEKVRPQAQAVFCIDVRSEPFRRHLESSGDYETFGFAGFFSVFVRYRALESPHETEQFPVIMKARNNVREVLRSYHGGLLDRHRSGNRVLQAGHALLHDLKENVVTPYVAVETLGWFYGLPLVGKTLFPVLQSRLASAIRRLFVPRVSTTLTVDKLSRDEVNEMLAGEQRAVIRRALKEEFGDRELNLSLERLEFLRQRALEMITPDQAGMARRTQAAALSPLEEESFVGILRSRYRITPGWAFARMEKMTRIGFSISEQILTVETALRMMGMTRTFARLVLFCGHGSTSDNNPFESALDCGACGGNKGKPNARILATMANRPHVREGLEKRGITVPSDTFFIAGEHDTTTDAVTLFDLEDLPHTHNDDLLRLSAGLREAGLRNARERSSRFPEFSGRESPRRPFLEARRRSADWSQVRPEWGLSGNASFIIGRRDLTRGLDLGGRAFLHSYDTREDPSGRLLEGIMTGPQVVGEWISMEHYFSTVDNEVYGGGSKIYHNVVGRFGLMTGPQSDLRTGLARQTVRRGDRPYHEPMRLLTLIEAPPERIGEIILRHLILQQFYDNEWVRLTSLDPEDGTLRLYLPKTGWIPLDPGEPPTPPPERGMP